MVTGKTETTLEAIEAFGAPYKVWREFVESLVLHSFDASRTEGEHGEAWSAIFRRIKEHDTGLAGDADSTMNQIRLEAIQYAATLGYALGRTWPAGMDGFDDWLGRAKALAGVE